MFWVIHNKTLEPLSLTYPIFYNLHHSSKHHYSNQLLHRQWIQGVYKSYHNQDHSGFKFCLIFDPMHKNLKLPGDQLFLYI